MNLWNQESFLSYFDEKIYVFNNGIDALVPWSL